MQLPVPAHARLVTLLFAALLAAPSGAEAITRVYLQNNSHFDLEVTVERSGHSLADRHWGVGAERIPAGERRQIVWFNRDTGIKSGEDFFFTQTVRMVPTVPPVRPYAPLALKQRLRGRMINSRMWQAVESDPWHRDRSWHTNAWDPRRPNLRVIYRAYFAGTDDNIEYVVQDPREPGPDARSRPDLINTLEVLAYNVYLRPIAAFRNGQAHRIAALPRRISGYDVVTLSEVFVPVLGVNLRAALLDGLRSAYPFVTQPVGRAGVTLPGQEPGRGTDAGIIIASRWPFCPGVPPASITYGSTCHGSDCLGDKGAAYACIVRCNQPDPARCGLDRGREGYQERRYHVFATHLQADDGPDDIRVRTRQLQRLAQFIESRGIHGSESVIIAGDLNVDRLRLEDGQPAEYQRMLQILGAEEPRAYWTVGGLAATCDNQTNRLCSSCGSPKVVDYVLYRTGAGAPDPGRSSQEIRLVRSPRPWCEFAWECLDPVAPGYWDLSDHHAVYARLSFDAPRRPPPIPR